jgi:hypothetical protein
LLLVFLAAPEAPAPARLRAASPHQQELLTAIIEAGGRAGAHRLDLHDFGIGSTIATVKLLNSRLSSLPNQPPPSICSPLIEELTVAGSAGSRSISHSLYFPPC